MIFGLRFADYAENTYFPEAKKTVKTSSYYNFWYLYQKFLKPFWGNEKLKNIDCSKVQNFYEYLAVSKTSKGKYLSRSTITRGVLGLFRTICNHAARNGKMPPLLLSLKTPKNVKKEGKIKIMNEIDLDKLKKILNQPLNGTPYKHAKIFAILALYQGLRIGEACGLKWSDIDFKNNTIEVKRTVNNVYDPETHTNKLNISTPKTESSARIIPMLEFVARKLGEYKGICYQEAKVTYCDMNNFDDFYILARINPTTPRVIRSGYERLLNAYDIPYTNPHSLRHSFCTNAINKNCSINAVSKILGHSNTTITQNVYNHLTQKKMNEAVDILNKDISNG